MKLRQWFDWWFRPPVGRTLQERYPAAPGVPTFSYSSVHLPEEAFVQLCPWCGGRTTLRAMVRGTTVKVIECRDCRRITKIEDLTAALEGLARPAEEQG